MHSRSASHPHITPIGAATRRLAALRQTDLRKYWGPLLPTPLRLTILRIVLGRRVESRARSLAKERWCQKTVGRWRNGRSCFAKFSWHSFCFYLLVSCRQAANHRISASPNATLFPSSLSRCVVYHFLRISTRNTLVKPSTSRGHITTPYEAPN
jgi:hypothetical protein